MRRWWLLRPDAHRALAQASVAEGPAMLRGIPVEVVRMDAPPVGVWLCDFCNTKIDPEVFGGRMPMYGSNALCAACVAWVVKFEGTKEPSAPSSWSWAVCGCAACQEEEIV